MIDTVSYQKITTYPLGEYKRKALQARYQYKCDTFTLVEDDSDYITSIILQSAKRKDSIIIVDPCEKLYSEARAFLREENYNVNCFSDKYYSTSWSVWENTSNANELIDAAKSLLLPLYSRLISREVFEKIQEALILCIASFMSYAVSTFLLYHNKFQAICDFIKMTPINSLSQILKDTNDTTECLWNGMLSYTHDPESMVSIAFVLFNKLAKESQNTLIGCEEYDFTQLSKIKSLCFIESRNDPATDVLVYNSIFQNILYQEQTKGRGCAINVIINNIEKIHNKRYIYELLMLSKKYKINFFITTASINDMFARISHENALYILSMFHFIILRKCNSIEMKIIKDIFDIEGLCVTPKQFIISEKKAMLCNKFVVQKQKHINC
jgi:hypothetical protein